MSSVETHAFSTYYNRVANSLGFSLQQYPFLSFVVDALLTAPLPPFWVEFYYDKDSVYYFDALNEESHHAHPAEPFFRDLVDVILQEPLDNLDEDDISDLKSLFTSVLPHCVTVTPSQVLTTASLLSIDPSVEPHLLWIPKELLSTPLPEDWQFSVSNKKVAYKNTVSNEVSVVHPLIDNYRTIVVQYRTLSGSLPFDFTFNLELNAWMKFEDYSVGQEYFYNFITQQRQLTSPVPESQLIQRPNILPSSLSCLSTVEVSLLDDAIQKAHAVLTPREEVATLKSEMSVNSCRKSRSLKTSARNLGGVKNANFLKTLRFESSRLSSII
ncbi:hypothetical protein GEMRC1_001616 [Eukaryota sp. GEM-RC1]